MHWVPPDGGEFYRPPPKGRIARGLELTRKSWELLCGERRLWVLPAISAVAVAVAAAAIFVPAAFLLRHHGWKISVLVASTAAALPLTLISTFFNVAFLATVDAHARGRELGIRDALRFARSRFRAILAWSLLATLVGSALRALENVNGADLVARLFSALAGLAWSLATYFVIPILAMEQLSVRESMKRSAQVFRRQWGPQVTGDLVISAFFGILVMPGLFTAFAGYTTLSNGNTAAGVIVVAIAVLLVAPVLVMSNAITQVFSLAVYRHAMGAPLPTPFTEEDVRAAFKPKKPPFWRRWRRKGAEKE